MFCTFILLGKEVKYFFFSNLLNFLSSLFDYAEKNPHNIIIRHCQDITGWVWPSLCESELFIMFLTS